MIEFNASIQLCFSNSLPNWCIPFRFKGVQASKKRILTLGISESEGWKKKWANFFLAAIWACDFSSRAYCSALYLGEGKLCLALRESIAVRLSRQCLTKELPISRQSQNKRSGNKKWQISTYLLNGYRKDDSAAEREEQDLVTKCQKHYNRDYLFRSAHTQAFRCCLSTAHNCPQCCVVDLVFIHTGSRFLNLHQCNIIFNILKPVALYEIHSWHIWHLSCQGMRN